MNLSSFLDQSNNKSFWDNSSVLCFCGEYYPLLFFKKIFKSFCAQEVIPQHEFLNVENTDLNNLLSSFQQSFLGQTKFYWLGDFSGKLDKKKEKVLDFLFAYQGPNLIALFIDSKTIPQSFVSDSQGKINRNFIRIDIPALIEQINFPKIVEFFAKSYSPQKSFLIKQMLKKSLTLSLDEMCRLLDCVDLFSSKDASDFERYINLFIETEKSLFTLSSYFFAKNSKSFFSLWNEVSKNYPDIFWIMYWEDQIWRAYYVVKFQRQKKLESVRKISARLPFSFTKMYWRNFSLHELAAAHEYLYKSDFALKTGSEFCSLDFFYSNYFLNKFGQETKKSN